MSLPRGSLRPPAPRGGGPAPPPRAQPQGWLGAGARGSSRSGAAPRRAAPASGASPCASTETPSLLDPGDRGMHSFTLGFENSLVPAGTLIGEAAGEGKGCYLQMGGFAAGRLQAGGRASGLAQAALEATATYASERRQFGRPIGDFQLTQHKLGRMATHLAAARQLTYAAARAMDRDGTVVLEPAMAKLFASDVAGGGAPQGPLLPRGWGYAAGVAISPPPVDAPVLPI